MKSVAGFRLLISCLFTLFVYILLVAGDNGNNELEQVYQQQVITLRKQWVDVEMEIANTGVLTGSEKSVLREKLHTLRNGLKSCDFWLRYYEQLLYKKVNAPLPVEWETEVFEKFEKPYKREGAGLILAELYLDEDNATGDSLRKLLRPGHEVLSLYLGDSLKSIVRKPDQFLFANRLFLLNLATIYTTGFECPSSERIIPELSILLESAKSNYIAFNKSFPGKPITEDFLLQFDKTISWVSTQADQPELFDHFVFVRDFVNPLFAMNQEMIRSYGFRSRSFNDFALNNKANSIFSKALYTGQSKRGVYAAVNDEAVLNEIKETGRLLFFDPLLSGNGQRSCAGCHKPDQCFTDTLVRTAESFGREHLLPRNTPGLTNLFQNHLIMQDGKHILVEDQIKGVITNPEEMDCSEKQLLGQVLSCAEYKKAFKRYTKFTPSFPEITSYHIVSAIMVYLSAFSEADAPFDKAMNKQADVSADVKRGYNLFMSKAQCGTCHFAPVFNGVKPPYVGSEFEVLGVPADTGYHQLSPDSGRYLINPAFETFRAFRTGTLRNIERTAPYMHNGVFKTIDEVLRFYNEGGGAGHGLEVNNQTLSADSLHLTTSEMASLKAFLHSLNEEMVISKQTVVLPSTKLEAFRNRVPGGVY